MQGISKHRSSRAAASAIKCTRCKKTLHLWRQATPKLNSCGFECYTLECGGCRISLTGIIDPYDDEFLVSEIERPTDQRYSDSRAREARSRRALAARAGA
jgi:hypothetical protein